MATGISNTFSRSADRKQTSWGRTRRPKALYNDAPVPEKQTATSVTCVAAGVLSDNLSSTTAGQNGYSTENQDYLHIQIENDGTDDTLKLYAYNYAFAAWSQLYLPLSLDKGDAAAVGEDADADNSGDTLQAAVPAGTVANAYAEAKFETISGKYMVIVPIHGIDRIAFVHDGANDSMIVRAAGSTL